MTAIEHTKHGHENLIDVLSRAFGDNYREFTYLGDGGTSHTFTALWGPAGEKRFVKVDKPDLSNASPRARRHVESGCDTANELQALADMKRVRHPGLVRLLDYTDLSEHGHDTVALAQEFFESESLEDLVQRQGALDRSRVNDIFRQIFGAVRNYYNETGRLHRDPKPSNILIGTGEREGEYKIGDFANSRKADEIETKYNPTAGSIQVTDWLLMSRFTGEPAAYDEQSEIYGLVADYFYARRGRAFVEINPDTGQAVVVDTGESLLDEDGLIDRAKYEKALIDATRHLSGKERDFVRSGLTSDLNKRHKSLDEMVIGFETFSEPGFFDRHGSVFWSTSGVVGSLALIAGIFISQMPLTGAWKDYADALSRNTEEVDKFEFVSEWNGVNPHVNSGFVKPDVTAFNASSVKRPIPTYPTHLKYLAAEPGDSISVFVMANEEPRPLMDERERFLVRNPTLRGRAYIQGLPMQTEQKEGNDSDTGETSLETIIKNDFWVQPVSSDQTTYHGYGASGNISLQIPQNAESGVYTIAVELYQPTEDRIEIGGQGFDTVEYSNPGGLLATDRIRLVVGNPNRKIDVASIDFDPYSGYGYAIHFVDLEDENTNYLGSNLAERGIDFEFRVPEEGFRHFSKFGERKHGVRLVLPDEQPEDNPAFTTDHRTLEVIGYDSQTNEPLLYTAFPIRRVHELTVGGTGRKLYEWDFGFPGIDWSERLVGGRKRRSLDSHEESN